MKRPIIGILTLAALPFAALADPQDIRRGAQITADQAGHAFSHGCRTGQPLRMERRIGAWQDSFGLTPVVGSDHDFAYASDDGSITAHADIGTLRASCTMTIATDLAGDGAALYESLEAHFAEDWWKDSEVVTEAIDGGLRWRYDRSDVTHVITFVESPDVFTVTHVAER